MLAAAPFVVFDQGFFSAFHVPKLLAVIAAVLVGGAWLAWKGEGMLPTRRHGRFMIGWAAVAVVLGLRGPTPWTAAVELSTGLVLLAAYVVTMNLGDAGRRGVLLGILAAATLEAVLAIAHLVRPLGFLLPFDDPTRPAAIGTVGNPEFLATLLAAGLCIAWHLRGEGGSRARMWLAVAAAPMLAALVLTRSKGTAGLLALALLYAWQGWRPVLALGLVAGIGAPVLFPDSVYGRVMLWIATGKVLVDGLPFGTGFEGLTHHYLDAVCALFANHPGLSARLGTYVGDVRDAHNLVIDQGIALGLPGAALAAMFLIHVVRRGRTVGGGPGAMLLILSAKMLYTVVLGSVTGAWLLTLLLGISARPEQDDRRRTGIPFRVLALAAGLVALWFVRPALTCDRRFHEGSRMLYMGDPEGAKARFELGLGSNPGHAESILSLAFIAFKRGEQDVMTEYIGEAIRLEPVIDIVKRGAHMYFFNRQYEQAEPLYRKLMLAYPDRRSPVIKLAQVRLALGDRREAESLARKVIAMQPRVYNANDVEYLETARKLLSAKGDGR